MPCTPKQAEANRINAQKSTGPRTAEGKERSKFNAVRHGLDAKSLVIPGEDPAEVQDYLDGIVAALAPRDEFEADLCSRMAKLSWKLLRAERVEPTVIRSLMERAELDDKKRREAEVHRLLSADPETERNVRSQLEESAEGCRWMIDTLAELDAAVAARKWRLEYDRRLDLICGSPTQFRIAESRAVVLSRCINPNPPLLWPPEEEAASRERIQDILPEHRYRMLEEAHNSRLPAWEAELRRIIAGRVAELEALLELRLRQTATERAAAAHLAPYAADASLERVRKAIRSAQNEQNRLRKALDAHRAEVAASFPPISEPTAPPCPAAIPQAPATTTTAGPTGPNAPQASPSEPTDTPPEVVAPESSQEVPDREAGSPIQAEAAPGFDTATETPGD